MSSPSSSCLTSVCPSALSEAAECRSSSARNSSWPLTRPRWNLQMILSGCLTSKEEDLGYSRSLQVYVPGKNRSPLDLDRLFESAKRICCQECVFKIWYETGTRIAFGGCTFIGKERVYIPDVCGSAPLERSVAKRRACATFNRWMYCRNLLTGTNPPSASAIFRAHILQ